MRPRPVARVSTVAIGVGRTEDKVEDARRAFAEKSFFLTRVASLRRLKKFKFHDLHKRTLGRSFLAAKLNYRTFDLPR